MDLKDFVRDTLTQIIEGVTEAQSSTQEGTSVNPVGHGAVPSPSWGHTPIQDVEFDVAVTTTEETGAGGGITVFGVGVGAKMSDLSSSVSRIKFRVPVAFPMGKAR